MDEKRQELIRPPVLTMKNLYRMLTMRDFPMHSYAVFPRTALSGMTLLLFWQTVLTEGLPEGTDLSFFNTEGGYSRTLTWLINRTGSPRMMENWFAELTSQMDAELLMRMTDSWMRQLIRMRYSSEALDERLEFFLQEILRTQDSISESTEPLFRGFLDVMRQEQKTKPETPRIFQQGVILSWLTLFALYGTRPQDPMLIRLSTSPETKIESLYAKRGETVGAGLEKRMITHNSCVLAGRPLSTDAFLGRQSELAEAARLLIEQGKVAVTGIGGIGKTEFTRHLMAAQGDRYGQITCVSYQNSLEVSFSAAFSELLGVRPGEILPRAKELLQRNRAGKTLLVLDYIGSTAKKDPTLDDLTSYGCDILVTTRLAAPKGFAALNLGGLDMEDSRKLFLQNDPEAEKQLQDVDALCAMAAGHPLAIQLFARLCRTRYMSAGRLYSRLKQEGLRPLSYIQQAEPVRLADEFRKLFDTGMLDEAQRKLITLMTLLPFRGWRPEELLKYAGDVCLEEYRLGDLCQILSDLGWLLRTETGYTIHPMIAETVRLQPAAADDFPRLWEMIASETEQTDMPPQLALIGPAAERPKAVWGAEDRLNRHPQSAR